ncbi:MAG TPA: pseudouridine synthase [Pseudolabrys sp.]|nr:pseudouridine synthase [Pseudolabrys sp.]
MADKPILEGERIAKVIARAGLASRREAEAWIAAGRVAVNGKAITSPALNVGARDRITIDGAPLPRRARTRLFLYHKPRGLVTSHSDPEGRPTIFAALPKHLPRLISVGRLDMNTEGLLLLTNDGGLARVLELPATQWLRSYRVRALGRVTQDALDPLRKGITIDGIRYGAIEATLDREQGANVWLTFAIREGKNREVRRVLEHLGLKVNRLIRVSYGPFELGKLDDGDVKEIETAELRRILGPEIARQAEADFEAPLEGEQPRSPLIPAKAGIQKGRPEQQGRAGSPLSRGRAGETTRAQNKSRDEESKRKPLHNRRRRPDRSGGPRPSRPRPK